MMRQESFYEDVIIQEYREVIIGYGTYAVPNNFPDEEIQKLKKLFYNLYNHTQIGCIKINELMEKTLKQKLQEYAPRLETLLNYKLPKGLLLLLEANQP